MLLNVKLLDQLRALLYVALLHLLKTLLHCEQGILQQKIQVEESHRLLEATQSWP